MRLSIICTVANLYFEFFSTASKILKIVFFEDLFYFVGIKRILRIAGVISRTCCHINKKTSEKKLTSQILSRCRTVLKKC